MANELIFTCGNRNAPRQPIAVRLICVIEPEVVVRPRQSVRELYRVADLARRYRRVGRWRAVRRIVHQSIESVLLFIHVGNFYHEIGTKAILQMKRSKLWDNVETIIDCMSSNEYPLTIPLLRNGRVEKRLLRENERNKAQKVNCSNNNEINARAMHQPRFHQHSFSLISKHCATSSISSQPVMSQLIKGR